MISEDYNQYLHGSLSTDVSESPPLNKCLYPIHSKSIFILTDRNINIITYAMDSVRAFALKNNRSLPVRVELVHGWVHSLQNRRWLAKQMKNFCLKCSGFAPYDSIFGDRCFGYTPCNFMCQILLPCGVNPLERYLKWAPEGARNSEVIAFFKWFADWSKPPTCA